LPLKIKPNGFVVVERVSPDQTPGNSWRKPRLPGRLVRRRGYPHPKSRRIKSGARFANRGRSNCCDDLFVRLGWLDRRYTLTDLYLPDLRREIYGIVELHATSQPVALHRGAAGFRTTGRSCGRRRAHTANKRPDLPYPRRIGA
jgi:hypothetical protein